MTSLKFANGQQMNLRWTLISCVPSRAQGSIAYVMTTIVLAVFLISGSQLQAQDKEQQAFAIASIALKAQNEEFFEFAAEEWERLLKNHADSSYADRAFFNSGICYIQLRNYEKAIKQFEQAIPKLKDKEVQVPTAKFYLGYAQYELGSQLLEGSDAEKARSTELLTTATKTFGDILKSSPKFEKADNVCYFQAGSFERLNRLEDALAAYKNMANYKSTNKTYLFDSMFAICDLNEQLGQYGEALKAANRFIAQAKPIDHPLLDRVTLLKGRILVSLAMADQANDNEAAANRRFAEADAIFRELSVQDATGKPDDFSEIVQEADYQRAFCLGRLKKFEEAGALYAKLVTDGDPKISDQAQAYAGANFLSAGKIDRAIEELSKSIKSDNKFAVESAHLLAGIYLKKKDFKQAYEIADRFLPKAKEVDSRVTVDLMLDRADAAYGDEARRKESIELFEEITNKHPKHRLAAPALYNAAFAALQLKDLATAIKTAKRFEQQYEDSDYLVDVLGVKADALLLDGKNEEAVKTFDQLTADSSNPNFKLWQLRAGLALYLQKKYQPTIDRLTAVAGNFGDPAKDAEAYHWIGSSHYQLKDYAQAEAAFQKSLSQDQRWKRADEGMAFLCRCQLQQDKLAAARATAQTMIDKFPKSTWLSDVYYQLGNKDLDEENFVDALANFERVIDGFADSSQLPGALYGAAWSHQNLKQFEKAESFYKRLISKHPDHPLVENAKIQRASLQRRMGKSGASVSELKALLATDLGKPQRVNVLLELGLAQAGIKDWPGTIKTFKELIDLSPEDDRKDDFYYELAWASRSDGQEAEALDYFGKIVSEYSESPHAAEANFHLGNAAYEKKDFPEAITRFTNCIAPGADPVIQEKAAYKLGWSFYKQDKFPEARGAFQKQVDDFKEGDLIADGKFMLAETYYRQKKYKEAFQAYLDAKPAIDASTVVDKKLHWLTMLHGSQSANKAKNFDGALSLAKDIDTTGADDSFKQDVYLELGTAYSGLKKPDEALEFWNQASVSLGKTGARAYCMIGDQYFREKKFDDATDQFKRVFYGFGAENAPDDIRPWQAYARYEAARCNFVQVSSTSDPQLKQKLIDEAIKHFRALLEDYPEDRLAPEAKKQLEKLRRLKKR